MIDVVGEAAARADLVVDCGSRPATTVLVVDDSSFDRLVVGKLLESMAELRVAYASNGQDGLDAIEREAPAVILTDLIMPDMEGLELVRRVRAEHPHISVILVTAYGSEEVAMQALRAGAANYIPKKQLARDLVPTVRQVLTISAGTLERRRILRCMVRRESAFVLKNDPDLIMPLLRLIQEEIDGMGIWDQTGELQVVVALQEALVNALFHGNLEVSSDLRQEDDSQFEELARQRQDIEPYRSRRIRVQVQLDRDAARFVVGDDGPGYDISIFTRPVDPDELNCIHGRGLLLIRTFMDEVTFNRNGNQITMLKYRSQSSPPSRSP